MIGADDIALVQGAPALATSEFFRQTNDFYYLSGVEVPHSYLLLDGRARTAALYLPHRDAAQERSDGPRLSAEDAAEAVGLTGIELVQGFEALSLDLQRLVLKRGHFRCYTPLSPAEQARAMRDQLLRAAATAGSDPWESASTREARFVRRLQDRFPMMAIADLSPVLDRLRLVKSEAELHLLRIAGRLSALAVTEAMRCTQPGVMEFELAAVANLCFTAGGARGEGYHAIIGGGTNAWFGHYGRLGSPLQEGDLVLMDYAPDVAYYTSDIGRMWPVNGTYSRVAARRLRVHRRVPPRAFEAGAPGGDARRHPGGVGRDDARKDRGARFRRGAIQSGGAGGPGNDRAPFSPRRDVRARRGRLHQCASRGRHGLFHRPHDVGPRGAGVHPLRRHCCRHR